MKLLSWTISGPIFASQIENFWDVLTNIGLFNLGYEDLKFTWKGEKASNDYIHAHLDRDLFSLSLSQIFPSCMVHNTSTRHSDTLALFIRLSSISNFCDPWKTRPKCFELHWTKDEECFDFFDKLWLPDPSSSAYVARSNFCSILDHL